MIEAPLGQSIIDSFSFLAGFNFDSKNIDVKQEAGRLTFEVKSQEVSDSD